VIPKIDRDRVRHHLQSLPLETGQNKRSEARAAVALILRKGADGPEILLIQRASRDGDPWSGQMAFPGGKAEPQDESLEQTARRETGEEVGADLAKQIELLGSLADLDAMARGKRTGLIITPFVYWISGEAGLTLAPAEVAEAIWVPLLPLMREEANSTYLYRHRGMDLQLPAYEVKGKTVWGLTYQMLSRFLAGLK